MKAKPTLDELIVQKIAGRFACNQCGRKYRARNITTVDKWDASRLLRLACAWCGAEEVLSVVLQGNQARAVLLDLVASEWTYFRRQRAISVNDVVNMARAMRDYDGDFSEILEEPIRD
ncbi:MAG TPA: hypothetical protein VIX58_11845 [Anaerolineae bacterium]